MNLSDKGNFGYKEKAGKYLTFLLDGRRYAFSIKKIIEGNRNVIRAFKKNSLPVSSLYPIRRLLPKAYNILKNKIGRGR